MKNNDYDSPQVEHITVNQPVERTTIVERDYWYSEPWLMALVIGAIAVIAFVGYWAVYAPSQTPAVVEHDTTKVIHDQGRAQTFSAPAPVIVNNPPAVIKSAPAPAPNITVNNPPAPANPTTAPNTGSSNNGSSDKGSGSNDNSSNNNGASTANSDNNGTSDNNGSGPNNGGQ